MQLKLPLTKASKPHAYCWESLDDEARIAVLARLATMIVQAMDARKDKGGTNDD